MKILFKLLFSSFYLQQVAARILDQRKLSRTLHELQKANLDIKIIYDIGARYGKWSKAIAKIFTKSDFYLFEASDKCLPELNQQKFQFFIAVLSSKKEIVSFYESDTAGDSYYEENTTYYNDSPVLEKETTTLDCLREESNIPLPDFIKLDTQGSELDILKGAKNSLVNTKLIYVECPIIRYNKGAPNIQEYIDYMSSIDFIPIDVCENHFKHKILAQIDILFIKKSIATKLPKLRTDWLKN